MTLRLWDESRLAINACEMLRSGNYLIPTFDGAPDMWNTKPPLMIWLQVLSMKSFGVNEWAVRFPSAMAALFTCMVILLFSVKYLKNFWFGFIWSLVLVTSSGYIEIHAVRTGDYDALLTLFLTLGTISFFTFLENSNTKYLYLFFISMALAVLTKSSAALMILPGLFLYSVLQKKLIILLKNKHLYIGLFIFLLTAGSYYCIRETYNPGYLQAVWDNEFGGRFLNTIEEHNRSFWYYFINLFDYRFIIWVFFVPAGIFVGLKNKNLKIKNLSLFTSLMVLTFFIIISSAQTKLPWYVLPNYPFLALFVGIFIFHIFSLLKEKLNKILPYIFLFAIFTAPYSIIIVKIYQEQNPEWKKDYNGVNFYLKNILLHKVENDNFTILFNGDFTHGRFYLNSLLEQDKNILLKNTDENINLDEIVLFSQNEVKDFLEEKYELRIIEEYYITGLYKIIAEKN